MSESHSWQYLIDRYLAGSCSEAEMEELLRRVRTRYDVESLDAVLKDHWEELAAGGAAVPDPAKELRWDERFRSMMEEAGRTDPMPADSTKRPAYIYWAAAAVLIFLLGAAGYLLYPLKNVHEPAPVAASGPRYKNDVPPGSNGAVLVLADGRKIVLDSAKNGLLAVQGRARLINRNGQVVYEGKGTSTGPAAQAGETAFNNLFTPRGRQYRLMLADGSEVWLNAASSIRYPTVFSGNRREVEITGEAYFEIAPDPNRPFSVHVNGMRINVLGTRFNVRAYGDEVLVKTTLLAGAVQVFSGESKQLLKPDQQADVSRDGKIRLLDRVDSASVVGWRDGYFSFNNTDLVSVMREIGRWYDVDVVYQGQAPERKFGGEISRNSNVSQVLKVLEMSKVYFRIEGKKIIVLP